MIAPNMATMIAVITTDADICHKALAEAVSSCVETSFNCITIDGDMSTNDSVFVLANGAAGNTHILRDTKPFQAFKNGLATVMSDLAEQMVRDGEEATKFVRVTAAGLCCSEQAKAVAMKVADSVLVKCAIYGQDANWGRIAAAAGAAEAEFDPAKMDIAINGVAIMKDGGAAGGAAAAAEKAMQAADIDIVIDFNDGPARATVLTTDLSVEYVKFNAHYRT
jgi:glutamate N-acetyltransferase/amino-acid N-acetyltransferase